MQNMFAPAASCPARITIMKASFCPHMAPKHSALKSFEARRLKQLLHSDCFVWQKSSPAMRTVQDELRYILLSQHTAVRTRRLVQPTSLRQLGYLGGVKQYGGGYHLMHFRVNVKKMKNKSEFMF